MKSRAGKPSHFLYYVSWVLRQLVPKAVRRARMRRLLRTWQTRPDADYIRERVQFYCPLDPAHPVAPGPYAVPASALRRRSMQSAYYIDFTRLMDYFPSRSRAHMVPGDTLRNPSGVSLIKARRLGPGSEHCTLLPLDYIRHFPRPVDTMPFAAKKPQLIFRGKITGKPARIAFFERFHGHPLLDMADTSPVPVRPEWGGPKISITAHFDYRYVLVLEGNDVASCLGWVMGSGCIPVMCRPTCEHWLMHSRLVPGVHYIEVRPDFTDLAEKIEYYNEHPDQARAIARASTQYYAQFADRRRERLIALLTLARHLQATGQEL